MLGEAFFPYHFCSRLVDQITKFVDMSRVTDEAEEEEEEGGGVEEEHGEEEIKLIFSPSNPRQPKTWLLDKNVTTIR